MELDINKYINNPNNQVVISFGGGGIVTSFLIDDFNFQAGAAYNSEFEAALKSFRYRGANVDDASMLANLGITVANQALGTQYQQMRIIPPAATILSWSGNDRLSFTLPLMFVATKRDDDIRTPVRKLLRAVNPQFDQTNLALVSAPNGYSASVGRETQGCVGIMIGQWFMTPRLFVLKGVHPTFSRAVIGSGVPLYATCLVTLDAYRMLSAEEIDGFFR